MFAVQGPTPLSRVSADATPASSSRATALRSSDPLCTASAAWTMYAAFWRVTPSERR
jgi:hypothetical protein